MGRRPGAARPRPATSPSPRGTGSEGRDCQLLHQGRSSGLPPCARRRAWNEGTMTEARRIYMAGSGGMLGEAFHRVFGADCELKCTDIDVNEEWLSHLDF